MADLFENPMGLMGFEFVELASPAPHVLEPLFDARVAILCEKPLCTTVADARWAVERAALSPAAAPRARARCP